MTVDGSPPSSTAGAAAATSAAGSEDDELLGDSETEALADALPLALAL
jgi:hypothetical protein